MNEPIMKQCTRCGRALPEDEFYEVKYKGQTPKNRYTVCRTCTQIEQRRRNLERSDPSNPLLEKIEELYEKHRAAGRNVPGSPRRSSTKIEAAIDELLKGD